MTHHPDLEAACSAALDAAEAHLVKTGLKPHQILVMASTRDLPEGGNACTGGLGFDDPGELLASLLSYALGMAKELGLDWHPVDDARVTGAGMSALTYELLRRRVSRLFERTMAEHGPVEDIVWERVVCDRCGRSVNLITEPWPVGWTTAGRADGGWVDLCGACSQ